MFVLFAECDKAAKRSTGSIGPKQNRPLCIHHFTLCEAKFLHKFFDWGSLPIKHTRPPFASAEILASHNIVMTLHLSPSNSVND